MSEIPQGGDANLRVYKTHGPVAKRLWYALKGMIDLSRRYLLGTAIYGEMPSGDMGAIKLHPTGALLTKPPHKLVIWNPTGETLVAFDTLDSGVVDVEAYNYLFIHMLCDGGTPEAFRVDVYQSEDAVLVAGKAYYTSYSATLKTVDADSVGDVVIAQKLVHKYVTVVLVNEGGEKTVDLGEVTATMVVQ